MARLLADLIIEKRRKFSEVNDILKEKVKQILKERGYDTDGNKISDVD